jgi:hypothetical protein
MHAMDSGIVPPHDCNTCTFILFKGVNGLHSVTHIVPPFFVHNMPKIRDSGSKVDIFEVTTTQTQQGKKVTHVPVKDSQPSPAPSRTASSSKKRALSPGEPEFNNNDDDFYNHQVPPK